jgi:ferredoxin
MKIKFTQFQCHRCGEKIYIRVGYSGCEKIHCQNCVLKIHDGKMPNCKDWEETLKKANEVNKQLSKKIFGV